MAATARIKLERTGTIMAALETSSVRPALLEVGQSPNAFFVNVTKCKATATTDLLCPIPTHSHINCLLICCSTNKNSIPQKLLPNDGLGSVPQYLSRTKWDQGKGEQGGTRRTTLVFKLELKFLFVFLLLFCVYGGSNSSPLVSLPSPSLGPRLVRTVYSENVPGLARSLSKHVIGPDTDRRAA